MPTLALKRRDKEQEKVNEILRKKEVLKALEEPLTEEQQQAAEFIKEQNQLIFNPKDKEEKKQNTLSSL